MNLDSDSRKACQKMFRSCKVGYSIKPFHSLFNAIGFANYKKMEILQEMWYFIEVE